MGKQKPSESPKIKLSVAIATFNEEKNIGDCFKSIKDLADEIVMVDGSSTDRTEEIAKKFGAKVITTANKPMFHTNKNMAIDNCRGEWILQLDADERVSPELAAEILSVIKYEPKYTAYWLKRKNYFLGRFLKKGGQYPDPVIRLFKKGKAKLPEESVHEQMKVEGEAGWLKNDLTHWATPEFSRYWLRENRYATLEAEKLFKEKVTINPFSILNSLILKPIKTFFLIFVRHKGFMDTWQGFIFAFFSGFHHSWAFLKYFRMRIKKDFDITKNWK